MTEHRKTAAPREAPGNEQYRDRRLDRTQEEEVLGEAAILRSPDQEFDTSQPYTQPAPASYAEATPQAAAAALIVTEASQRLSENDAIDAREVAVRADGGDVFLEGRIATHEMKRLVTEVVEGVAGVSRVHNALLVTTSRLSELKDDLLYAALRHGRPRK
jgi:BON domain